MSYIKLRFEGLLIIMLLRNGGISIMKHIHLRIEELLKEQHISKNTACKALDVSRGSFNKYCRDEFQRIDANLIVKLCNFLNCDIQDLMVLVDD